MVNMPTSVTVDIASTWASKINWTQAVGVVASIIAIWGINMPPETQVAVVALIQAAVAVITWVLRTFFTKTVTPSVAQKLV